MKQIGLALALVLSASSFAALPPYHQSVREIQAILIDKDVTSKLSGTGVISGIQHTNNIYLISTPKCALNVRVVYQTSHTPIAGPAKFSLIVGEVNCLP